MCSLVSATARLQLDVKEEAQRDAQERQMIAKGEKERENAAIAHRERVVCV